MNYTFHNINCLGGIYSFYNLYTQRRASEDYKRRLQRQVSDEVLKNRTSKKRELTKAPITRCDLSPRFFCNDATSLCELESDKI